MNFVARDTKFKALLTRFKRAGPNHEDLRADRDAWREQARRSDYLLGTAMERTRELENRLRELESPRETPSEPTGAPETPPEPVPHTEPPEEAQRPYKETPFEEPRRPWW